MNDQEMRQLINKRLSDFKKPEDIVMEVCDKSGIYWSDAEKLVKEIAAEHKTHPGGKEVTVSVAFSLLVFVVGFFLAMGAILLYVGLYKAVTFTTFDVLNSANALLYSVNFGPVLFITAITGIGMMVGGILGMRRLWTDTHSTGSENEGRKTDPKGN